MELNLGTETHEGYLSYELARSVRKLVEEVFPVRSGEDVAITADTSTDHRAVNATAQAIFALGAHPVVIWYESLPNATATPPRPVAAALREADAWIEFAPAYLLHGPAHRAAIEAGCRMLCLTAMDADSLVRTVGRQNHTVLREFGDLIWQLSQVASTIRITSPAGTDVTVNVDQEAEDSPQPRPGEGGRTHFPPGGSGFSHILDTVQGTVVFDGAIFPPGQLGALEEPVILQIQDGYVRHVSGGWQARLFERWLAGWDSQLMYQIAHFSYGFNPGVRRCTGRSAEDARVFGCVDVGLGITARGAPTHTDGVVLNASVWADDVQLQDKGDYVHPDLIALCREAGVLGY